MHEVSFPSGDRSQPNNSTMTSDFWRQDWEMLRIFILRPLFPPLVANVANHVGNCLFISGGEGIPTCDTNYHVTGAERERNKSRSEKYFGKRPLCPTDQYVLNLKNSFKAPGRLFKKQKFQIHICKKISFFVKFFL